MIWIIGNLGMLGQDLSREFSEAGIDFIGTDKEVSILEPEVMKDFAFGKDISFIINCSAYTAVDKAEEDQETAYLINKNGVENIARVAASLDVPLLLISTDYVFDGSSSMPLDEDAPTGPVGVYGASKLVGEDVVRKICNKHFIIRTAWLYGQYGPNFVYTMVGLMNRLETLKVVDDQIGSPTWTRDLTGLIKKIVIDNSTSFGTYHLSGEGECSWHGFASEIYTLGRASGLIESDCALNPCTSDEFPTAAKRPAFSLLNKNKVRTVLGYDVPRWQDSLNTFMKGIGKDDIL
ncbi:MAG: dTDP-4-dehydrorhamnose reductase [Spirochaetales bacterium]|nr:dTDP-4-dehydrorhamnose reductase [Spirochaetales bacterium]